MKRNRVTQHRPQTDEKIKNKKLAEAKREVQALKKTVGRLQKQLKRALDGSAKEDEDTTSVAEHEDKEDPTRCTACGSNRIASASLPTGTICVCQVCANRWKLP